MNLPHVATNQVTLVANPYSVHVVRWLKLFDKACIPVRIETAEQPGPMDDARVPVEFVVPAWLRGPMALRYFWMGVALWRRNRPANIPLHAHCTSGSGFTAWLSGHPYIVTTYGSEIFAAGERSWAYRWMIRRVLQHAKLVTATTPRMAQTLREEFNVSADRIRTFSLGYDSDVFTAVDQRSRALLRDELDLPADERVWVVNRRSLPLYRTAEVVSGFLQYCALEERGRLIVISGDDDPAYTRQLRAAVAESSYGTRIRLIREFLPAADIASWLQAADFAISVPKSDQLSTSILEAMACGAVPVLSDLESYRPLHECPGIERVTDCSPDGFARMFHHLATLSDSQIAHRRSSCAEFARTRYSEAGILDDVRALFGLPPQKTEVVDRAA